MRGKSEGLFLCTRHSPDCRYHSSIEFDRDESRRCNCVKYVRGTAPDGTRIRRSTGTASWEKSRKVLARLMAEHDPANRGLFNIALANGAVPQRKEVEKAIADYIETKRGENLVDVTHYEGLFQRQLLPWCKQRGIHYVDELTLELMTKFRNSLHNLGTVKNRKLSRLRSFCEFCVDRGWLTTNVAKKIKRSQEEEPDVTYFQPEEMVALENACFVSHTCGRLRSFELPRRCCLDAAYFMAASTSY